LSTKRFTFLPWDIYSWKLAFRWAGTSGLAMLSLLVADMIMLPDAQDPQAAHMHATAATIWLIRAPFTFVAALLLLSRPHFPKLSFRDLRLWFLIYVGFFVLSVTWSTEIVGTVGKSFEMVLAILIIMQASRDEYALRRLEGIYRLILLFTSLLALITVLGYLAGVQLFIHERVGIFTSTTAESPFYSGNGLGYLSISFLLVVFAENQLGGLKFSKALPQLTYALFIFALSSSRTSLAIFLLGIAIVLLRRSKALLITFCLSVGAVAIGFSQQILKHLMQNQSQDQFETLSGRTVMWVAAFHAWQKRPLLGYGGGVGGKYVLNHINVSSLEKLSGLHSGFMECLTGLGIVGLLLGTVPLLIATVKVVRLWKEYPSFAGFYIWTLSIWIMTIMTNGILGWMGYLIAIYIVLLAHIDVLRRGTFVDEFVPVQSYQSDNHAMV
jgi:O-antigen ligase